MVNTTPDDLYVPTGGATIGQLEARIGAVSTSVQAALLRGAVAEVANTTERDARFPSGTRSQGDRVYRRDNGWEEAYFEVYNSSTNPGGATTAGWYPMHGKLPYASQFRSTAAVINSTPTAFPFGSGTGYGTSFTGTATTIIYPGRYDLSANIVAGNGGGAMVFGEIRKNGATPPLVVGAARQEGASDFNSISVNATVNLAVGDVIAFYVWGSTGLTTGAYVSRLDTQYIGPA